ncbi:hypothetical protein BATDEDRAFT_31291 [Batrachochytrium dendrobatidis JAM81]|uniref:Uncharacterized protein n=1 Tax=Batrachochytrium dendrobatidis (strain JAM81 / FGSC 10211) TaxID=684364 RepID=F4NVE7_BATDJ|nr:uncharacterized protein BATDEDRAFT_31291 [Batrachochytrium dendrobatidis JAM81]EGF83687.1 hypothetical protein BATDEDRAFT_31291 [Batrachochytrium dendrobatidis JAM81]|eukprot:XP_006675654.1 hypothetical protein BATDEDRAFT_31291 [Batrachochytrium dendrobatidis JAM81]
MPLNHLQHVVLLEILWKLLAFHSWETIISVRSCPKIITLWLVSQEFWITFTRTLHLRPSMMIHIHLFSSKLQI